MTTSLLNNKDHLFSGERQKEDLSKKAIDTACVLKET